MRALLVSVLLLRAAFCSQAQSTLEFMTYLDGLNVVPPSSTPVDGTGSFSLSGTLFTYDITLDPVSSWRGKIYGPGLPGVNGEPLYDLNIPVVVPPLPPYREGYASFKGSLTVTAEQMPQLMSGLWYVQIASTGFPELAVRGQIVPVPEPSAVALIVLAAAVWGFRRVRMP